ncbi:MAG: CotH kinase family protein [Saprospiraceae bacterium]|nr:CotH kinase family protein [Candidatus Opimibacter iunctus]
MNTKSVLTYLYLLLAASSYAQAYEGPGGIITDDGVSNDYLLSISDLNPDILDENHGLVSVCITISHTWLSDLDIRLISPAGDNLMLTSGNGGDSDAYENTCFTMSVPVHILDGGPPFDGAYRPFTPLGNVNNGQSGNGTWILRILDTYAYADGGQVLSWTLNFGIHAPVAAPFPGSVLPIILLNTDNYTIPNEPKISGSIYVISNESGALNHPDDIPVFEGHMAIEVRGSSSQQFPKKSYSMETQDEEGNDLETSLLGLPEEEDWILYSPYTDKSFLRDAVTYQLGNELGEYAPRAKACELYVNGDYQGIYWLEEKIKRDKERVDIAKLNPVDTLGDELTGGYLLKVDRDDGDVSYFVSQFPGTYSDMQIRIVYEDPEGQDMHPKQKEYISNYFEDFEAALYSDDFTDEALGYRRYVDLKSVIDYFIICELGHNVDAYRLSTFFYKDRNSVDSTLHFGPLWDFNLSYGNVDYCHSQYVDGWAFNDSGGCDNTPLWWARFLEDPYYQDRLKCRYDSLRQTVLSTAHVLGYIDSMANVLDPAAERNYDRWPILSRYIWPNFFIGATYEEEINYMKEWMAGRLEWMDANIPGECLPVSSVDETTSSGITLVPNPAVKSFVIRTTQSELTSADINIISAGGQIVRTIESVIPDTEIDIAALPSGVYIVMINTQRGITVQQKLVILN